MRIRVVHPVPVRCASPRSSRDLIAYRAEESPVELPEVEPGTFARKLREVRVLNGARRLSWYAGTAWRPVRESDVGDAASPNTAPLRAVLAALGSGGRFPGIHVARPGTPLRGTGYPAAEQGTRGEALPDGLARRARADHGEAVRAALATFVSENLATDGAGLWVRTCPPVLTPANLPRFSDTLPWYCTMGPSFPPGRRDDIAAFVERAGMRARPNLPGWEEELGRMPVFPEAAYAEMDLSQFVNGAPTLLERAAELLMRKLGRPAAPFPAEVAAALERLRPLGDLGLVGAIPRARWAEAVEATLSAASALRAACPEGYRPEFLPWVESYHRLVAAPRLAAGAEAIPEDDLEGLGRLAP